MSVEEKQRKTNKNSFVVIKDVDKSRLLFYLYASVKCRDPHILKMNGESGIQLDCAQLKEIIGKQNGSLVVSEKYGKTLNVDLSQDRFYFHEFEEINGIVHGTIRHIVQIVKHEMKMGVDFDNLAINNFIALSEEQKTLEFQLNKSINRLKQCCAQGIMTPINIADLLFLTGIKEYPDCWSKMPGWPKSLPLPSKEYIEMRDRLDEIQKMMPEAKRKFYIEDLAKCFSLMFALQKQTKDATKLNKPKNAKELSSASSSSSSSSNDSVTSTPEEGEYVQVEPCNASKSVVKLD